MSTIAKVLPNPPANFSTTLSSGISNSDLTVPLNSVSGLATEGVGVIYAKDSEGVAVPGSLEFIHWTNTSGNNLTLSDTGDRGLSGSANGAQSHNSGDTFEVWVHPKYHFYDWAVAEHNANGTHASGITLTSPTITSPSLTTFSTLNAPEGFLINGKIVPSVASNNLTVAIKGMDGNDPSASNPVYIRLGDSVRTLTSALSVTSIAGTNWCNSGSSELATKEVDYFVYLVWNTDANPDAVTILFSRFPYARVYSDFNTGSSVAEKSPIIGVTVTASDNVAVIGRFAATLSAGAGYTWSVPTFTNVNLVQKPIFESRWLDWSPTVAGFSGTPSTYASKYRMQNDGVSFYLYIEGTSNSATFTATLPFTIGLGSSIHYPIIVPVSDNGTWQVGVLGLPDASATVKFGKSASLITGAAYAGFTTSGTKAGFVTDVHFRI